jgi:hypothetical protein
VTVSVPVAPTATFSPSSLTFVGQQVGTTSAARSVTLTNTGNAPLPIDSLVASGDFGQTNACPVSLAVDQSCTINVTFSPTLVGTRTGTVVVSSHALAHPGTLNLSGTATPEPLPLLTLSTTSLTPKELVLLSQARSRPRPLHRR